MRRLRRPRAPRRLSIIVTALALSLAWLGALPPAPASAAAPAAIAPAAIASPALTRVDIGWASSCAVVADGTVRCWGRNDQGQLGNGTGLNSIVPVTVAGITTATDVSVGMHSACAVLANGSVRCWGSGDDGVMGNGSRSDRLTPVTVTGISTATSVSVGTHHACARIASGKVRCWGGNDDGQLGDGTTTDRLTPVTVNGITTATSVSAGSDSTCARLASGALRCWGYNGYGQLGDGTLTSRRSPVAVSGIADAVDVSAGAYHSCATLAGGGIRCWGSGGNGVLGTGSFDSSPVPVAVSGITTASSVSAGMYLTCAVLADQSAACWGDNGEGGLGAGTTTPSSVPVPVLGLTTATRISSGTNGVCALLADQSAACWGYNFAGQLGDRTVVERTSPVAVSWAPDLVRPTAVAPTVSVRSPGGMYPDKVRAAIRWNAADDPAGTGIDHYQLQKSRDGGATWTTVKVMVSRGRSVDLAGTGTVRYRVRAWDRAGNVSAWATGPEVSPRVVQQTSSAVTWTGTWTTRTGSEYFGGSTRWTKTPGATATYRFTGWSVGYVTPVGPTRGSVDVYVDGVFATTLDLQFVDSLRGWVAWSRTWPTRGTHTVTLVAHGTEGHPRVDVDAFSVIK